MKNFNKKYESNGSGKVRASFTVEASMIMPLVVLIVVGAMHMAIDLQEQVADLAEQEVTVYEVDPVEEMYSHNTN